MTRKYLPGWLTFVATIFIASRTPLGAETQIEDVRARAARFGREPGDILFFQGLSVIVGGSEEEAKRKEREIDEYASDEGYAAHMAGNLGIDLAAGAVRAAGESMRDLAVQSLNATNSATEIIQSRAARRV